MTLTLNNQDITISPGVPIKTENDENIEQYSVQAPPNDSLNHTMSTGVLHYTPTTKFKGSIEFEGKNQQREEIFSDSYALSKIYGTEFNNIYRLSTYFAESYIFNESTFDIFPISSYLGRLSHSSNELYYLFSEYGVSELYCYDTASQTHSHVSALPLEEISSVIKTFFASSGELLSENSIIFSYSKGCLPRFAIYPQGIEAGNYIEMPSSVKRFIPYDNILVLNQPNTIFRTFYYYLEPFIIFPRIKNYFLF